MADNAVTILYGGNTLASLASGQTATIQCATKRMESDVVVRADFTDSALPLEITTEAEMAALLESGQIGAIYKYTGETGTYENGCLYMLEVSE